VVSPRPEGRPTPAGQGHRPRHGLRRGLPQPHRHVPAAGGGPAKSTQPSVNCAWPKFTVPAVKWVLEGCGACGEVAAVQTHAGEGEVAALPGDGDVLAQAGGDGADDGVAHLPQRGELQDASAALGLLVPVGAVGQRAGFGLVGHAQVGAEHVDTHLPQRPGGASSARWTRATSCSRWARPSAPRRAVSRPAAPAQVGDLVGQGVAGAPVPRPRSQSGQAGGGGPHGWWRVRGRARLRPRRPVRPGRRGGVGDAPPTAPDRPRLGGSPRTRRRWVEASRSASVRFPPVYSGARGASLFVRDVGPPRPLG